jgi:hypothetical protein
MIAVEVQPGEELYDAKLCMDRGLFFIENGVMVCRVERTVLRLVSVLRLSCLTVFFFPTENRTKLELYPQSRW